MSHANEVKRQLAQLAQIDWETTGINTLTAPANNGTIVADLTRVDGLACEFSALQLHTTTLADACIDELKSIGEQLSKRLVYLLEPIQAIESDEESVTLQMRSNPPTTDDDGRCYYELTASREGLHLTRFRKEPGSVRQRTQACVTREVFVRLADDFDKVLNQDG